MFLLNNTVNIIGMHRYDILADKLKPTFLYKFGEPDYENKSHR